MGWELTFDEVPEGPIEIPGLNPAAVARLSIHDLAHWPVQAGNRRETLGQYAAIQPAPDEAGEPTLVLTGHLARLRSLALGMESGRLRVIGHIGSGLGAGMSGGRIDVEGNTGDRLGQAMRGGLIHVRGSAGDQVGSARPGQALGMRDGVILVDANAGDDVGLAMRRGLIAVGGSCGRRAARGMVAGSVFALGGVGPDAGLQMKRGTLLVGRGPAEATRWATFRPACRYRPAFLGVYFKHLASLGFHVPDPLQRAEFERFNGDVLALGKGEILCVAG
jgi:formylmethanofuran dehydrogenase subunit C